MAKLSYAQLTALVANIITTAKISNASFEETANNTVGLIDKVGKIITLDTVFTIDKLSRFDGEYLPLAKTIEEWQEDLILPSDYDASGANALSPHNPTYRPVFYSYTIGRKKVATSIYNNDIERCVNDQAQFVSIVAMKTKRLSDSMAQYRYALKREMIAHYIALAKSEMSSTTTFAYTSSYAVNALVRNADTATAYGIVVKPYTANTTGITSWADAVAAGYIIVLDLVKQIAVPVDTNTGEAFIKAVKEDVEIASDISEGHSLNGNTLGVTSDMVLLVKQGVIPTLQVDTLAGAFNKEELAFPTDVIVVKDFGSTTVTVGESSVDVSKAYAVLVDGRGMRLHNTYNATRSNENGDGDFLNIFRHTEDTPYLSRNTFIKVYEAPSA